MGKKCKCPPCPPEGAPEWVLTFGDMMSLLLTFFIMLVAMSTIETEKWQDLVQGFKNSNGLKFGGSSPTDGELTTSTVIALDGTRKHDDPKDQTSRNDNPGIDGREDKVTKPQASLRFVIGGYITFELGSAELDDHAERQIRRIGEEIKGKTHQIEIVAHAASAELVQSDSPFKSIEDLCYARAQAVRNILLRRSVGVDDDRLRIVIAADKEPIKAREDDPSLTQNNRRVEIIQVDVITEDYRKSAVGVE